MSILHGDFLLFWRLSYYHLPHQTQHAVGLWISLNMNYRYYSLETYLNATVDATTHVYCHVEYYVLTMQLPQHCTCKTKHYFAYIIVPAPHERKKLHESEHNSHESEMFPTTNSILTQRQVDCWCQPVSSKYSHHKTHKNYAICQQIGDDWLIQFCGSLWTFCDWV